MKPKKIPSLRNLTNVDYGKPADQHNTLLKQLGAPHVQSFNYMVSTGLQQAIADIEPVHFMLGNDRITLRIVHASISYPQAPLGTVGIRENRIFPSECRQRAATYRGKLIVKTTWYINDIEQSSFDKDMGDVPIMIMSNRCHLNKLLPKQLVERGEHEQEWGGYFVIKGLERLIRMLLMTRRNYPIAIRRSGWKGRDALFSDIGISIRCVREDQTATTNVLHYVTDGTAKLMFSHRKLLYYTPLVLILKCLCDHWDHKIYERLIQGYEDDLYFKDSVQKMLRNLHLEKLHTHEDCKNYLGNMFRVKFTECPPWYTDAQVADFIIKKCILIHLNSAEDKFNLLVHMTQKLFTFAQDKCKIEGADSVMMQELLLGGHLYLQVVKDKLQSWLHFLHLNILKRKRNNVNSGLTQSEVMTAAKFTGGLQASMEVFLATGNLTSSSGLGLQQDKGLTIVAENINRMRYMSHFKSVHRGAFFQEMRTTEVRQLLPDAWGFICPVHTPDGAPCGLLNHLTVNCMVTDIPDQKKLDNVPVVLTDLGVIPINSYVSSTLKIKDYYVVQLDGKILGHVHKDKVKQVVGELRLLKIKGKEVPITLEIVLVPLKDVKAQFPGLYLFTGPARMMRPLINLATKEIEFVGSFEQVYLDVCTTPEEFYPDITTHMELTKTDFMSNLANLIPMPDCNQSPRNMYQCQMGKQTMGTPCLNWNLQAETKLYRLQTPGSPLFRSAHYDRIELDDFAMGTNAVVAVISYTGYDMEDAMVINKSSYEFGFAHGSIYKSEFIELDHPDSYFCRDPRNGQLTEILDTDGLPFPGRIINGREIICCYFSHDQSKYVTTYYPGKELCYVDSVKLCGNFGSGAKRVACITVRVPRNPSVGDKFASRAGQKGICSQKWPAEDLPFTETGLVPDIIFNPHGFPSRMTIAMMIELMAGKSAALHGFVHDATPFQFNEDDTAIDYFGRLLEAGGYNYYGTETMYSGIDGREMKAEIFFGIVYYQRLRHMVSDKWQVRSKGPIDVLTRQPIKGRKKGGGVRFGEMERDGLISHGTSFLLQDRLFHCSDKVSSLICTSCQTLVGPITLILRKADKPHLTETEQTCQLCKTSDNIAQIEIPYILKYFVSQLASCNIIVHFKCEDV